MIEWIPTCFSDSSMDKITIEEDYYDSARRIRALLRDSSVPVSLYPAEDDAYSIFTDIHQKTIIESLLISADAEDDEISEILGISKEGIDLYRSVFFNLSGKLRRRIALVSYIEQGMALAEREKDDLLFTSFTFKKWSMSLGKEFIIWKYSLKPIDMSTSSLYNTIVQEAFFYHKEKSLSDKDVPSSEYQRSMNSLLSGLKIRNDLASTDESDASDDFMENLDIIIEEEANDTVMSDFDSFINNVDVISKDDIGDIYENKEDDNE